MCLLLFACHLDVCSLVVGYRTDPTLEGAPLLWPCGDACSAVISFFRLALWGVTLTEGMGLPKKCEREPAQPQSISSDDYRF